MRVIEQHEFVFPSAARPWSRAAGICQRRCLLSLTDEDLRVDFGPWRVETPLANVCGVVERLRPRPVWIGPWLAPRRRELVLATDNMPAARIDLILPVRVRGPIPFPRAESLTVTVHRQQELTACLRRMLDARLRLPVRDVPGP
jgi:hypothetical protein